MLEEARRIALLISEERIASDQVLDVIGGAAGTILGLTALYEAVPDREILERAIACGEHLLETRTENETGHRAWVTDEGLRTTGYSHGTAGIVYALLRLYEHTRDARLLETAKEAIAYEDTQYSPENRNWVDFARPGEPVYKWQWCRGAPGIGLARLGGLAVLDTEQVHKDIELSLQATLEFGVQGVDHPCCGNMGRAEVLLASGRRLSRPELEEAARERAWRVVTAGRSALTASSCTRCCPSRWTTRASSRARPASATSCCAWPVPICSLRCSCGSERRRAE